MRQRRSSSTITATIWVALLVALGSGFPASAQASEPGGSAPRSALTIASGAALRYCTNLNKSGCSPFGSLSAGTRVTMYCYTDDSYAVGAYRSNRWFYVTGGGKQGYVHSSRVNDQATVPNCSTNRGVRVSRWAATRVGVTGITGAERRRLGVSELYWTGNCALFARASHVMPSPSVEPRFRGNAIDMYRSYEAADLVQGGSPRYAGSLVFYPESVAPPYGHVAVYLGNGMVATTRGGVGDPPTMNTLSSVNFLGVSPLGWVRAADV